MRPASEDAERADRGVAESRDDECGLQTHEVRGPAEQERHHRAADDRRRDDAGALRRASPETLAREREIVGNMIELQSPIASNDQPDTGPVEDAETANNASTAAATHASTLPGEKIRSTNEPRSALASPRPNRTGRDRRPPAAQVP